MGVEAASASLLSVLRWCVLCWRGLLACARFDCSCDWVTVWLLHPDGVGLLMCRGRRSKGRMPDGCVPHRNLP